MVAMTMTGQIHTAHSHKTSTALHASISTLQTCFQVLSDGVFIKRKIRKISTTHNYYDLQAASNA